MENEYEIEEKTVMNFLKRFYLDFLFVLVVILCTSAGFWGLGILFYIVAKYVTYNPKK